MVRVASTGMVLVGVSLICIWLLAFCTWVGLKVTLHPDKGPAVIVTVLSCGMVLSFPRVPAKVPEVMAGEGFRMLPTLTVTSPTFKFATLVNIPVNVIVLSAVLQLYPLVTGVPSTTTERHVGVVRV